MNLNGMIPWELSADRIYLHKPSVAAVSYLNTVPLVWGFLYGPQTDEFLLDFCVPSECARRLESGQAQIGIVPVVEMQRQALVTIPGTGIACHCAVRSILLISKVPIEQIRTIATDSGSRTSVQLTRVILRHRYGVEPQLVSMPPDLRPMLDRADAALLIGDAALRVVPNELPYLVLDLGEEWWKLTGLPMVFALWSGPADQVEPLIARGVEEVFRGSLRYGQAHMSDIVAKESSARHFAPELVLRYLTEYIKFDIGPREQQGLEKFLGYVADLNHDYAAASPRFATK
ncbi:MAG: menaquinone biosynthesis protein [Bryobacterales bacterium]|nr:menaquinone biosynthesis protein [Bryobacterales bacterium]